MNKLTTLRFFYVETIIANERSALTWHLGRGRLTFVLRYADSAGSVLDAQREYDAIQRAIYQRLEDLEKRAARVVALRLKAQEATNAT